MVIICGPWLASTNSHLGVSLIRYCIPKAITGGLRSMSTCWIGHILSVGAMAMAMLSFRLIHNPELVYVLLFRRIFEVESEKPVPTCA